MKRLNWKVYLRSEGIGVAGYDIKFANKETDATVFKLYALDFLKLTPGKTIKTPSGSRFKMVSLEQARLYVNKTDYVVFNDVAQCKSFLRKRIIKSNPELINEIIEIDKNIADVEFAAYLTRDKGRKVAFSRYFGDKATTEIKEKFSKSYDMLNYYRKDDNEQKKLFDEIIPKVTVKETNDTVVEDGGTELAGDVAAENESSTAEAEIKDTEVKSNTHVEKYNRIYEEAAMVFIMFNGELDSEDKIKDCKNFMDSVKNEYKVNKIALNKLVKTSYSEHDCVVLLKDLTSYMQEMSTDEREKAIQSGAHYSEMLPEEKEPSEEYEALYNKALQDKKHEIAEGIAKVAEMMQSKAILSPYGAPVIISLARAGIPVGILIKRYIKQKYNIDCPHYAISIIRDKGIDINAMEYIYNKEVVKGGASLRNFFFVDGWTGKGAIKNQLTEAVAQLKDSDSKWNDLSDDLWVLDDPANITPYCGTHSDYLLPSACLNSTVSGLISRTILNKHIHLSRGDLHGAVYFSKFESVDKSNEFIDTISNEFKNLGVVSNTPNELEEGWNGMSIVQDICNLMQVGDYKKVKPGIGETTRVLLRRVPWKVLINKDISDDDADIQHILVLCREKNIPTMRWDLGNYKVCGIIKELSADA